ncbi:hypothetical protein [Roseateles puraquae]|nr:hypothetical protein [Roseateles puraquae]MDG0852968.1 hypothetical protein [Roseateles puraquae]
MGTSWDAAVIDDALAGTDAGIDALTQLPRPQRGLSPNLAHWHVIGSLVNDLRRWFPGTQVRVDKSRGAGQPGARLRPDANFNNPRRGGAPTHIEVDTQPAQMRRHIHARNRALRNVFLQVDPASGALLRKLVYPPGAPRPQLDRRGTQTAPVRLRPTDVFDEFDGG